MITDRDKQVEEVIELMEVIEKQKELINQQSKLIDQLIGERTEEYTQIDTVEGRRKEYTVVKGDPTKRTEKVK